MTAIYTRNPLYPPACAADYRDLARKKLPRMLFDYLDGGAYNEITIENNSLAYDDICLRKQILYDVVACDTSTQILGQTISQPLVLAPIGFAGFYAQRGEVQAACAAQTAQIPFCLSTLSVCSIEEVHSVVNSFWFQLYMMNDKAYCLELLHKAQVANCPVLVFTADLPVLGVRYRDLRNGMFGRTRSPKTMSAKLRQAWELISHPAWLWDVALCGRPLTLANVENLITTMQSLSNYRISLSWDDLAWLREKWQGKLVLKGILTVEDAIRAADIGVDGIVISNHAGRHLDTTPPTIKVLPEIAAAVGDKMDILIDGGIFNGVDLLKAIALGADACMIGRAWMYALAARGKTGVSEVIAMFQAELKTAMALLGIAKISDINSELIF